MKRSSIKFLHRVRIHGGEFDASARAMHRDGMTSSFQAAVETVSIATNERKQMSTKTTFKRIALVTVAALGFGVMSIVPSSAAVNSDTLVVVDGTAAIGETSTSTSATATLTFLPSATTDSMSVTAALFSAPAGNTALPILSLVETTSANVTDTKTVIAADYDNLKVLASNETLTPASQIRSWTASNTPVYVAGKTASVITGAKWKVYLSATGASVAGTYVVRITPSASPSGQTSTYKDVTIVVSATVTNADSTSTAYLVAGETLTATTATDLVSVVSANTADASNAAAIIKVTEANAAGTANESLTVTISGPGTLGSGLAATFNSSTNTTIASVGRSITAKYGNNGTAAVTYIGVFADGTSGEATITITGTTSGTVIGTKKVLFSGTTITTITAAVVNSVVGVVGDAKTGAISVVAKDSNGYQIYNPTVYVTSASTAIISTSYSNTCTWDGTDLVSYCNVTPVAAGTASITVGNRATAAATTPTTAVTSNAVSLRVGSTTPATATLAFDKASYTPGEKATITLTVKDSTGNAVSGSADNTTYPTIFATGGVTSTYAFYTGSDTTTAVFAQIGADTNVQTWTVFMPLNAATVTITGVAGASFPAAYQATKITATATVTESAGTAASIDAANEATDAANAATDAANAAAEAADAATAAAQDAADAVAALSTEVAGLIAALKAQITSLTNLVIKIQKKVKA